MCVVIVIVGIPAVIVLIVWGFRIHEYMKKKQ